MKHLSIVKVIYFHYNYEVIKELKEFGCELYQFYHFNLSCLIAPKCAFLSVSILFNGDEKKELFCFLKKWFLISGCRGAQVEEIWSLEPENFEKLK